MKTPKFVTAQEVVKTIRNGDTFGMVGMTLSGSPEEILKEMESSFLNTGEPRDLTFVHAAGISDKVGGMNRLGHEGMLKRVIGSHWGLAPNMMDIITNDKVEAFCMPLGVLAHLHSCAVSYTHLDVYKRQGIDCLDPIDARGNMDLAALKARYGDRIAFKGNVDCVETLVNKTEDQVRREVARCLLQGSVGGGHIISSSNSIHSGINPVSYTHLTCFFMI